jgi:mannose-1-phosphate guanylyltransferase
MDIGQPMDFLAGM